MASQVGYFYVNPGYVVLYLILIALSLAGNLLFAGSVLTSKR